MAGAPDDTVASFPTYAALTQTQAWTRDASVPVTDAFEDTGVLRPGEAAVTSRYTEGALLGVGGMGKVMLAHDARIGRDVAVKQLHQERELAAEERARFLREARVQGQLEHPAIVPVYDIDQRPDGTTFFTMRRVLGRTLHAILDDLRAGDPAAWARYTTRELLTAFATVCLTIDYAHSRGVIHRDLKPANLMLGDFGEVYVLDWGLARLVGETAPVPEAGASRLSVPGEMMGTPLYMAPEQMADPDVGPAADVFSLGAILFEILTLERAREPHTLYLPVEARPSVRAPLRGVAPELETICVRATESLPADRYPTARALQEAVVRYLEGDREVAQRRALAAAHGKHAREALGRAHAPGADHERERGTAMRELVRALALDPTNDELVATLAQIMATPPRVIPAEVVAELTRGDQQLVRIGARHAVGAVLAWFAFVPAVLFIGVLRPWQVALVLIPIGLAGLISLVASRLPVISWRIQVATIACNFIACLATTRLYGPLVLLPTLVTTFSIVLQAHPQRSIRNITWLFGGLAIVLPALYELAVPAAYHFANGTMTILPQMLELPRVPTILLLMLASAGMLVVPCMFIGRLRTALSELQTQMLVQAWHFRRLGSELTSPHADVPRVQ